MKTGKKSSKKSTSKASASAAEKAPKSAAFGKKAAKSKKLKKKAKLAKERKSEIERGMSVMHDTRKSSVKKRKKSSVAEDTEKLKKKKISIPDDEDLDDEDDVIGSVTDAVDADGDEEDGFEEDDNEGEELLTISEQLSQCDPGPDAKAVPCGFMCGSCDKFVALNDPNREDPEWVTKQLSRKAASRCPFLFPDEIDVGEGKSINDYVMRADTKACDKFRFNENKASDHLKSVIDTIRKYINVDELQILQFQIEQTRKLKAVSHENGYSLGEKVTLYPEIRGVKRLTICEVIDFQRKKGAEVLVRPVTHHDGAAKRYAIPARRISSTEED